MPPESVTTAEAMANIGVQGGAVEEQTRTSPAWRTTIVGFPASRDKASFSTVGVRRDDGSLGSTTMFAVPKPSSFTARVVVPCTSLDVITRTGGAPESPSRLTSHPARASTACLAAARQVTWAI